MSYWTEIRDLAFEGIDCAVLFAKEETDKLIKKGKDSVAYVQLNKELFSERQNLHLLLADLGDITYELCKTKSDVIDNPKVQDLTGRIQKSVENCKRIEEQIRYLNIKGL